MSNVNITYILLKNMIRFLVEIRFLNFMHDYNSMNLIITQNFQTINLELHKYYTVISVRRSINLSLHDFNVK